MPRSVLSDQPPAAKPIRSFKRRSRMTAGQRSAWERLAPSWVIDPAAGALEPEVVFGRRAPLVIEIGFGMGETTLAMAIADPARDVLALDVHVPGAGALLRDAHAAGVTNLRLAVADATAVLTDAVRPGSVSEIRVFFPDPWPKARHHKRRLVTPAFVALAASRLEPGGTLHLATDWADYAQEMLAAVAGEPTLANPYPGYAPRPAWRPVTRFEAQGLAKGHLVADIIAERTDESTLDAGDAGDAGNGGVGDGAATGMVEVVAAALVDDLAAPNRVLAARRTEPIWAAGRWELPGGKRERGESAVVALRRELIEELGVQVQIGPEVICPSSPAGWPIRPGFVMRVWWAAITSGDPQPLADHDDLRWLGPPSDWVAAVDWLEADLPILAHLAALASSGDL